jgi:nickel-dependent lactate racemase
MTITFPYEGVADLVLQDGQNIAVLQAPQNQIAMDACQTVKRAMEHPIGTRRLRDLAVGRRNALIVIDDNTRPTPTRDFIEIVIGELHEAGLDDRNISFVAALGTHRPMSREEIELKLGEEVAARFKIYNHDWRDPDCLEYIGETGQGDPVYVNRIVSRHELVVGVGAIMPIDICGFTGGGKILVPGLSGEDTVNRMHWSRVDLPSSEVIGKAENPIRESIDSLARKAGLDFIVNVIVDCDGQILHAVAGDMVAAHRAGCSLAASVFGVEIDREYDIVIADSYPFDIEFWQANKALDTAGEFVKIGGAIVLITPCKEGWSSTHAEEILRFGYRRIAEIKRLVTEGEIHHCVVGVHMYQVARAAVEKARLFIVSSGLPKEEVERLGFTWCENPQEAYSRALQCVGGESPEIAVLRGAAQMLPLQSTLRHAGKAEQK